MKKILFNLVVVTFGVLPLYASAQPSRVADVTPPYVTEKLEGGLDHEVIKAIAKAANVPDESVPELIDQQGAVAEFVEHLSDDLKDQFSGVWIDDSHEVHVAST